VLNLFGATVEGRIKLLGAAVVASIASLALAFVLIYRANSSDALRHQTAVNCVQTERLKTAIREVLRDARTRALASTTDQTIRQALTDYYKRQIERFHPLDCPNP
jgi:hypothetical protein